MSCKLIEAVVHLEAAVTGMCSKLNPEVGRHVMAELAACRAAISDAMKETLTEGTRDTSTLELPLGNEGEGNDGVLSQADRIAAHVAIESAANRCDPEEVLP